MCNYTNVCIIQYAYNSKRAGCIYKRQKKNTRLPLAGMTIVNQRSTDRYQNAQFVCVRMAEWSKAPDSRHALHCINAQVFWSTYVGVGSNPTPDKVFLLVLFYTITQCLFLLLESHVCMHTPFCNYILTLSINVSCHIQCC